MVTLRIVCILSEKARKARASKVTSSTKKAEESHQQKHKTGRVGRPKKSDSDAKRKKPAAVTTSVEAGDDGGQDEVRRKRKRGRKRKTSAAAAAEVHVEAESDQLMTAGHDEPSRAGRRKKRMKTAT